jgi:hypothetical protein
MENGHYLISLTCYCLKTLEVLLILSKYNLYSIIGKHKITKKEDKKKEATAAVRII